jgi:hypothetical protein
LRGKSGSSLLRMETSLRFCLHDHGIPSLRCIAAVGGLCRGKIPVDIDHPDMERIYAQYEKRSVRLIEYVRVRRATSVTAPTRGPTFDAPQTEVHDDGTSVTSGLGEAS